ncbi:MULTISPECIES: ribose-5-phosphate isomerase RpiA [Sphingomonas]|uniref:ribose-5-phosphate isomerase RpiA n=1 Tax=Sphingomonas TaxID=13687 RepID=UPI0006F74E83|nr:MULTISPECIES: ribose-5-phosphate isomerase RpiA [Sphingomonas]KQM91298.1 ribose 5-phosphate isomerase [Sphingomonas sp. Leaf226]MDY0966216.1 ribose-5-phosphate isomerase RpiA [Sphingomonas sp. CFBP9021]USQ99888.1 ribose-5-phosphate isomerase RpiA [Sphingomonas aerolata]
MIDDDKQAAAVAAVAEVRDGMLVGLGTGSTAAFAIRALGERVAAGLDVRAVVTSEASGMLARQVGIAVLDFADIAQVDLTIDGADEINARCFAIKGAGGAMLREKIVAASSARMVVIADGSKRVERIGAAKLPVELLPFARAYVMRVLSDLGGAPVIRPNYRTDQDNLVADCRFPTLDDPHALAAVLAAIPGVLGHGLFLDEVDAAYIASKGVVTRLERSGASA